MRISNIKFSGTARGKFLRYASAVLDGKFVIKSMRLIQTTDRIILSMPAKQSESGDWKEFYHPINREMRQDLESAVLGAFKAEQGEAVASK